MAERRAEYDRDRTITRSSSPLNVETRPDALVAAFVTPAEQFYIRSHGEIPALGRDHAVVVRGQDNAQDEFTVADLKARFTARTVVATLQCAGNRRSELDRVSPVEGDKWQIGAIGNAEWEGVSLAGLIGDRVSCETRFVIVTCADIIEGTSEPYEISIPLEKALDPDTLLAWGMNGADLLPQHGAPLRLVVPGYAGVRSAKWVTRIALAPEPSDSSMQATDYKLFPPSEDGEDVDWSKGITIETMPVSSAICCPADGAQVPAGPVTLRGWAIACGRSVARVDVSGDDGRSWTQARIVQGGENWAWVHWEAEIALRKGDHRLAVRAIDEAGQTQPENLESCWNFKGYLCASWHRIEVRVV